jgi:glycosyltransferase involved in cell wall biosynthesis
MRIGLNAIDFQPGHMGGVETYFRNLVDRLQRIDKQNRYLLLANRASISEFSLYNPNFSAEPTGYVPSSTKWFIRGVLRQTLGLDPLKSRIQRLKLDVVHHPFSVASPLGLKIPTVLTFWDMQQEFYPDFFSPLQLRIRRKMYPASAKQATKIIASTHFTKRCLIERYGIPEHKIEVIYIGFGPGYQVMENESALNAIRRKYQLEKPFLFYPAAAWPHKNHGALLSALKILKEVHGFEGDLVLTGIQPQSQEGLRKKTLELALGDSVKFPGYLPYEELPSFYNLARLLVFPSLFEGFGIPLVEAMACGCPVVCSNATCLPEIIGDAGITFDPMSPEDMAEKIWSVWSNDEQGKRMRQKGLERAKMFDWGEAARKTISVYENTAAVER